MRGEKWGGMMRSWRQMTGMLATAAFVLLSLGGGSGGIRPYHSLAPHAATHVFVTIGASDAFGIGTHDPRTQAWPAVLTQRLGSSYHLVNLGVPGATTDVALRAEVPVAQAQAPALVMIWLGVNDYNDAVPLETFTAQLRHIILLLASPQTTILVGNLPDLTLLPAFAHFSQSKLIADINAWNAAIAMVCRDTSATLVDLFVQWNDLAAHPEYISSDGFHPSDLGARRLAAIFLAAFKATSAGLGLGAA